jgi:hypothetical protein
MVTGKRPSEALHTLFTNLAVTAGMLAIEIVVYLLLRGIGYK